MSTRYFQTIGHQSDVAVLDTGEFGAKGIEIQASTGSTWSCLSREAAIEQLEILRDRYGLLVPDQCIVVLAAEVGGDLLSGAGPPMPDWWSESIDFAAA